MSEVYTLYVFPKAEADDQLASELAALSGSDARYAKVVLQEGGTLGQFSLSKAQELSRFLGLLGIEAEPRASLPVVHAGVVRQPKTVRVQHVPNKKRPFCLGVFTLVTVVMVLVWSPWRSQAAPPPGVLVANEPLQSKTQEKPWQHGNYLITPLADYDVTARVLSKKNYAWDNSAELSPVDFVLGWGIMSDSALLDTLRISQSRRWFYVYWQSLSVDPNQIMGHSANTHILPANNSVARQIKQARRNDIIRLRGYLVQVTSSDGFSWRSSLTRSDTGNGSCEVFWVTSVEIIPAMQVQVRR
jgi:hypothetical protein